jgi:hypothetical protein
LRNVSSSYASVSCASPVQGYIFRIVLYAAEKARKVVGDSARAV